MTPITNEQIEKAVNWWASQLTNVSRSIDSDSSVMSLVQDTIRAEGIGSAASITEDQVERFKAALRQWLQGRWYQSTRLDTNYEPDYALTAALEEAGIDPDFALPPKISMLFYPDGSVSVQDRDGRLNI